MEVTKAYCTTFHRIIKTPIKKCRKKFYLRTEFYFTGTPIFEPSAQSPSKSTNESVPQTNIFLHPINCVWFKTHKRNFSNASGRYLNSFHFADIWKSLNCFIWSVRKLFSTKNNRKESCKYVEQKPTEIKFKIHKFL